MGNVTNLSYPPCRVYAGNPFFGVFLSLAFMRLEPAPVRAAGVVNLKFGVFEKSMAKLPPNPLLTDELPTRREWAMSSINDRSPDDLCSRMTGRDLGVVVAGSDALAAGSCLGGADDDKDGGCIDKSLEMSTLGGGTPAVEEYVTKIAGSR